MEHIQTTTITEQIKKKKMAENVTVQPDVIEPVAGTAGVESQVPGAVGTVSNLASATGGVGAGNLVQPDIDEQLFRFNSDDTPLMNLMLRAKKVSVQSPEVDHYMIDEQRAVLTTSAKVNASTGQTAILSLDSEDQSIPQDYDTLLVRGVDGYDGKGVKTPGKDLMLFVVGTDDATGNPIVRACNGVKTLATDQVCKVPEIPAGTKIVVLSNALYETQKEVAPDLIIPQPTTIYLQKRGMNRVVSDYFDAQKKRIPFTQAIIAEQAIANFKTKGNRTLWASRASKFQVKTPKMGFQYVYTTEGVRWQFKKELQHAGKWTVEQFIGLAKMFFTGEDVPKTAIALCGKNFLEAIQCIDYTKHPEIQISAKTNPLGWVVTNIHTVFGDIEFKREPTLDRLGYSNSCGILGENRLVHYVYRNELSFNDDVEGEEAKRSGMLVWDGLGLKGSCHIWIDGEGEGSNAGATNFIMWSDTSAPSTTSGTKSAVYYLLNDVSAISAGAKAGELWYFDGSAWKEYAGEVTV